MIAYDKKLHLASGFIAAVVGFAVARVLGVPPFSCALIGVFVAGVAGYVKEEYDKRHPDKHTYDIQDIYFTIAGGVVGSGVFYFVAGFLKA